MSSRLLYGRESVQNKQGMAGEGGYKYICFSLRKFQKWVLAVVPPPPSLCPSRLDHILETSLGGLESSCLYKQQLEASQQQR